MAVTSSGEGWKTVCGTVERDIPERRYPNEWKSGGCQGCDRPVQREHLRNHGHWHRC